MLRLLSILLCLTAGCFDTGSASLTADPGEHRQVWELSGQTITYTVEISDHESERLTLLWFLSDRVQLRDLRGPDDLDELNLDVETQRVAFTPPVGQDPFTMDIEADYTCFADSFDEFVTVELSPLGASSGGTGEGALAVHEIEVDCPAGPSAEPVELTMAELDIDDATTLTSVSMSPNSGGIDLWIDQQWPSPEEGGETRILASGTVSGSELERGFVDCGIYGEASEYSCRIFSLPDYAVVDTELITGDNTSDPAHIAVPITAGDEVTVITVGPNEYELEDFSIIISNRDAANEETYNAIFPVDMQALRDLLVD